jgi:hypothetical protein
MPSASSCLDTRRAGQQKAANQVAFHAQTKLSSGLVDDFLDGILALPDGLLRFALAFLQGALNLKLGVAYSLSGSLLDRAGGLIGHAFDLVSSAAHDWCPDELMAARSPALHRINATIWVRVAPKMIFVEKVFDESLSSVSASETVWGFSRRISGSS